MILADDWRGMTLLYWLTDCLHRLCRYTKDLLITSSHFTSNARIWVSHSVATSHNRAVCEHDYRDSKPVLTVHLGEVTESWSYWTECAVLCGDNIPIAWLALNRSGATELKYVDLEGAGVFTVQVAAHMYRVEAFIPKIFRADMRGTPDQRNIFAHASP